MNFKEWINSGIYFNEIKKDLFKIIEKQNLQKVIKIRDFSDIQNFKNKSDAEKYRKNKDLDLIIWWDFSWDGLIKDGQEIHQIDINFTFRHPDDPEHKIKQVLLTDFSSKLAIKNYWQILENNSFNDVKLVSKNLFHISTYIIGITTMLYWRVMQSVEILEWLNNTVESNDDIFRLSILINLENLYRQIMQNSANSKNNIKVWITYAEKLIILRPNDQNTLSFLAFFYYINGEEEKSEQTVDKQIKLYARFPSTEVNVAFLRIMQKKYQDAFHCYERLTQKEELDFNPIPVIDFLSEQYRLRWEVGLLYGSGLISYFYWDKQIAKEDLSNFIKIFPQENCQIMFNRARKILEKLN